VAPAAVGWLIDRTGGSFIATFGLFAAVELVVLAVLVTLARDPARPVSERLSFSY
jgi:hypothetical protein